MRTPLLYTVTIQVLYTYPKILLCTLRQHIPIKYHFLREQVSQKVVKLEYIDTNKQIVEIFTKSLPGESFAYLRQKLGVIPHH